MFDYQKINKTVFNNWLKSFHSQPKREWSKEDKGILIEAVSILENYGHFILANKLKSISLRHQKQWKPSEEQINALYDVLNPCDGVDKKALESLYEQLKELL